MQHTHYAHSTLRRSLVAAEAQQQRPLLLLADTDGPAVLSVRGLLRGHGLVGCADRPDRS
eukprot:scaffold23270_cov65-Phaeocystis_antarctica.AAC.1